MKDSKALWLSLEDVAEQLGVGYKKVVYWIETAQLRAVNLTKNPAGVLARRRVRQEWVDEFLAARTVKAVEPLDEEPRPPAERKRRGRLFAGGPGTAKII